MTDLSPPLTVAFDGPVTAARHISVLAGLSGRFRTTRSETTLTPDVLVVDGTIPDWPAACAGARAVLVDRPRPGMAELPDAPLFFADSGYATAPAWTAELPRIRASLDDTVAIVESTVAVPHPDGLSDGLFSQLALLRDLFGTNVPLTPSAVTPGRGYLLTGSAGTAVVSLSGTVGPPGLTLTTVAPADRWHITMPAPGTARSAVVTQFTADGAHTARPRFESPRRALWRTIHTHLTEYQPACSAHQLASALPDLTTIACVLATHEGWCGDGYDHRRSPVGVWTNGG
ncbi:hypothetical protein [Streptomyces albicerus]|uniref:hypothetical protein n=1 Tax=Streptomyces albicerus TaxID=2569859 RepID=UPI00124B5D6A|nr:hypothetical protein [Streptomyces albicerus]